MSNLKEEIEEWESGDEAIASLRFKLQRCFRCSIRIDETTSLVLCRHIHPPGMDHTDTISPPSVEAALIIRFVFLQIECLVFENEYEAPA